MKTTSHTVGTHLVLEVPFDGAVIDQEGFVGAIHVLINHTSHADLTDEDIREIVEKELRRGWADGEEEK